MRKPFLPVTIALVALTLSCSAPPKVNTLPTASSLPNLQSDRKSNDGTPPATQVPSSATTVGDSGVSQTTPASTLLPNETPSSTLQLATDGPTMMHINETIELGIQIDGAALGVAAFNLDIVYNQRVLMLETPKASLSLNLGERNWRCDLPPPTADLDPSPDVGRARLVCFSSGGEDAPAPHTPLTLAKVAVHGLDAGSTALRFENVGFFGPDARAIPVSVVDLTIDVE